MRGDVITPEEFSVSRLEAEVAKLTYDKQQLVEACAAKDKYVQDLLATRDDLRKKNAELNRRAQTAESAAIKAARALLVAEQEHSKTAKALEDWNAGLVEELRRAKERSADVAAPPHASLCGSDQGHRR